jgi:uncharacterized protein YjiS (DUF1127 family)
MTIFPINVARFPDVISFNFFRWKRRYVSAELEKLSDRSLEDVGLKPPRRDFDGVKPFWMP